MFYISGTDGGHGQNKRLIVSERLSAKQSARQTEGL